LNQYVDGTAKLPVPTYFLGGYGAAAAVPHLVSVIEQPLDCQKATVCTDRKMCMHSRPAGLTVVATHSVTASKQSSCNFFSCLYCSLLLLETSAVGLGAVPAGKGSAATLAALGATPSSKRNLFYLGRSGVVSGGSKHQQQQ